MYMLPAVIKSTLIIMLYHRGWERPHSNFRAEGNSTTERAFKLRTTIRTTFRLFTLPLSYALMPNLESAPYLCCALPTPLWPRWPPPISAKEGLWCVASTAASLSPKIPTWRDSPHCRRWRTRSGATWKSWHGTWRILIHLIAEEG